MRTDENTIKIECACSGASRATCTLCPWEGEWQRPERGLSRMDALEDAEYDGVDHLDEVHYQG